MTIKEIEQELKKAKEEKADFLQSTTFKSVNDFLKKQNEKIYKIQQQLSEVKILEYKNDFEKFCEFLRSKSFKETQDIYFIRFWKAEEELKIIVDLDKERPEAKSRIRTINDEINLECFDLTNDEGITRFQEYINNLVAFWEIYKKL